MIDKLMRTLVQVGVVIVVYGVFARATKWWRDRRMGPPLNAGEGYTDVFPMGDPVPDPDPIPEQTPPAPPTTVPA